MSGKLSYKHTIFACYAGYITQAIVNNLSPLLFVIFRDTFDLPLSEITLLITINFLIQLCIDCLSAVFVDKIGYRKCIVAAHVFAVAGLAVDGIVIKNPMCCRKTFENYFDVLETIEKEDE